MTAPEVWQPIPSVPGHEASSHGRVRSLMSGRPRVLSTQTVQGKPYLYVAAWLDGRQQKKAVHRLVAEAFHGPLPEGLQTRHLDGDPTHNEPDNLRYGTPSENAQDTVRHGRHRNVVKTHCPKNHPYDAANTFGGAKGRRCRTCESAKNARAYLRRKAVAS